MILRRVGNKSAVAHKITPYFPPHESYIELFAGAGGMFFNKQQVKYNFLNDIDEDIYNLWHVVQFNYSELIEQIERLPIHEKIFKEFKKYKTEDKVFRAVLFLFYPNFGYMGKPCTLRFTAGNTKEVLLGNLSTVQKKIQNCFFLCCDFRAVLGKISYTHELIKSRTFIYADPPYLGATNNYSHGFKKQDTTDLFDVLVNSGIKFALSEFQHKHVLYLAEKHGLNVHIIGKRQSMKKRDVEILITNYPHENLFNTSPCEEN